MSTATLDETATVRELFGESAGEPTDALAKSLRQHDTISTLAPGLAAAVAHEVATESGGVLSLELFDLAMAGWKKYEALTDAARRTLDTPTAKECVALVTHKVESSHHPTVDVSVDGRQVGSIEMELTVTFDMAGVVAVVHQARLTGIRSGSCTITGTLKIEGTVVIERQRRFDLPGTVGLHGGIPLLSPAAIAGPSYR